MNVINERYSIVKKISETNNSLNYVVDDALTGERSLLKMLNLSVTHPFPLEYFKKEYVLNALLRHPLIRSPYNFEACVSIDGNAMAEPEYFFCTPYYDDPEKTIVDYDNFIPQIADVLSFLHKNGFFHGDIRRENYFLSDSKLVLFDISAFIPKEIGIQDDVEKIRAIIVEGTGKKLSKNSDDISTIARDSDTESVHLSLIHEAIQSFQPPLTLLFSDHKVKCNFSARNELGLLLYHVGDVRNAWFWLQSMLPEVEIEGYRRIIVDSVGTNENFTLLKVLIRHALVYDKTKAVLQEFGQEFVKVEPTLPYSPSAVNSNHVAEEEKLIRLALHLLETMVMLHPVVLVLPDLSQLDSVSVATLKKMNEFLDVEKITVLIASDKPYEFAGIRDHECPILSEKEVDVLLRYFFYYYRLPPDVVTAIADMSGGEIANIADGLQKMDAEGLYSLSDGSFEVHPDAIVYFNTENMLRDAAEKMSSDLRSVMHAMAVFGGAISIDYVHSLETTLQRNFLHAENEGLIVLIDGIYRVRNKNALKVFISASDGVVADALCEIVRTQLMQHPYYIVPIQKRFFQLQHYDQFVDILKDLIIKREANPSAKDPAQYVWSCYIACEHDLSRFNKSNTFFILEQLLWLTERYGVYEPAKLFERLKAIVISDEQRWRYYALWIQRGEATVSEMESVLQEIDRIPSSLFMVKWRLMHSLMVRYVAMGSYEKALTLYHTHIEPLFSEVTPNMQFMVSTIVQNAYYRMGNDEKTSEYLERMRELSEQYPDQIHEGYLFSLQNNYMIFYARVGKNEEALEYAFKAFAIAKKTQDYRSMALINSNISVLLTMSNQLKKGIEYIVRSIDYAKKGRIYDIYLLAGGNATINFQSLFNYTRALELHNEVMQEYDRCPNIAFKSNNLKNGISLSYDLGLWDRAFSLLQKERDLILPTTHSLLEEHQFYALDFVYRHYSEGTDAAWTFLKGVFEHPEHPVASREIIMVYMDCMYFMVLLSDTKSIRKMRSYIEEHKSDLATVDNYNFVALCALIDVWLGDVPFVQDCCKVGAIEDANIMAFYFYMYCISSKKKDALFYEHLFQLVRLLHFAYEHVPTNIQHSFLTDSPIIRFYSPFLASEGISLDDFNEKAFLRKHSLKIRTYIEHNRTAFYRKVTFSNIAETQIMIETAMKNAMAISGFQRGIFFEYDKIEGWIKKYEVRSSAWFREDEDYINEIIVNILQERKDKLQLWHRQDPYDWPSIEAAICFPIIDITMTRTTASKKDISSSTSLHHLLALRGAFYFDTKLAIVQPVREDIDHLFYLREMINVAMYYNKLKENMMLDPLTRLYKRETWFELVKIVFGTANDSDQHLTIVMSDIDFFKSVNDVYGHKRGDTVLAQTAGVALKTLRNIDLGGRFGGEEFIFCLINTSGESAFKVVDRMRQTVAQSEIMSERTITISAGIAFYPEDGTVLNELIEKADQALLVAKETGRNKCVTWQECAEQNAEVLAHATPIISNPAREKDKIDMIIELLDSISVLNGVHYVREESANVCSRYLSIDDILFVEANDGEVCVEPTSYNLLMMKDGELPEKIAEHCALFAARPGEHRSFGLYFLTQTEPQKPLLEKRFYRFVANIILDRLISARMITR